MTIPQPMRTFVIRQRLDEMLDEAVTRPVTSLVAPAGAGKTASLARWASRAEAPRVHWLTAPLAEPVAALADAVTAAAHEPPDVLVIDDAHLLPAHAWTFLADVIAGAPDGVRLLIASRRDLPLATASLRLSDAITVLRGDVLRFDDAEAGQLITAHAPNATPEDIGTLQHRAQGWAAALVLGAHAVAAAEDRPLARAEIARTERPILDYLLGEVYLTLAAATRHLLLCICDEEIVTEAAAVLLSGDQHAAGHLAELAADGMLVTSYRNAGAASQEPAWRLHPLLRELLRRQTANDGADSALAMAAHGRAARHYAIRGPVADAVRHAVAAGEHELLTELVIEEGPGLVTGGNDEELAAGIRALGDAVGGAHPALLGVMALACTGVGDVATADRLAEQSIRAAVTARSRLRAPNREVSTAMPAAADIALVADAALLEARRAGSGWPNSWNAISEAREMLGCADAHEEPTARTGGESPGSVVPHRRAHRWPLSPARMAWLLHELAGAEIWAGDLRAARVHVGETVVIAQALGHNKLIAPALANRAILEVIDGRFHSAVASANECFAAAARGGHMQDSSLSRAYLAQAWASYFDVRLAEASLALDEVSRNEGPTTDPLVAAMSFVLRARLNMESGDVDGAQRLLANISTVPEPVPGFLAWQVAAGHADLALLSGDMQEVRRQAQVMREADVDADDTVFRWLLADLDGDVAGAVELLDGAMKAPAVGQRAVVGATAATYRTRIHLREGNPEQAEMTLREVLTRVAAQRQLYPVVRLASCDPALVGLLERLTGGPAPHAFAGEALAALRRYRPAFDDSVFAATASKRVPRRRSSMATAFTGTTPSADEKTPAGLPAPIPLSGREADVLYELALGGSYNDIAKALYITENTVKTHVTSTYRKLGADRRASALRRAREVGWL